MNRYISIFLVWLCSLSAFSQTAGYDPENPPLPDFPDPTEEDTAKYYTLVVNSSPLNSGSLNTAGGKYTVGKSVYLCAYNNGDLYFEYWIDGEGNTLSASKSFYYAMPAHDAVVTAVYRYSPSNPSLPDFPEDTKTYKLTLSTKPEGAGSFNNSSLTLAENASAHLYAYNNTSFYFQRWEDVDGNVISTAQNFYYTMPARDTQLYAVFAYNPSNPSNPGKNSYDSFTGEVIVDDFTKGSLSSAIYEVTNGNTSNITKITVAGKINSNDFSIANNYSTCTIVDLSRTSGVSTVPSYCYDYNGSLNRIYLPSCITSIGYEAFYYATSLSELTCYATVPPTLGGYVFDGVTKGMIVYVPASAIDLYENADGWKDYEADGTIVIMPIRDQAFSLEINLPDECADGRYKNMPLELMNIKSGQKYKYVVTDRINYIFNNLVKGTRYVATLKNLSGAVLAKSDTISIGDENLSYDFALEGMKQLRTVKVNVLSPSNVDLTSQCTVNWYDESGSFLSQGKALSGQVSGSKVKCSVALPQSLGLQYILPADSVYEVVEGENSLVFSLASLPTLMLQGCVIDKTTRLALKDASVTVSQTLNGKYSKSLTAKTDSKGGYAIQAFAAPSTLTFAASDYISQTIALQDSMLSKAVTVLDTVKLKPISGATITTDFTYTSSVALGEVPETQNYYSDYNNVAYTIYNETAHKAITQFNVQYPNIVLLEEVDENDLLTITARSKNSSFKDIVVEGRIDDSNRMSVTVPVVQWGGINATFTQTENSAVLGILYDVNGKFVKKYSYGSASLTISELKDGEYTLVTMGESDFFGSIYDISKFKEAGLQQNIDYVLNKVNVCSGVMTQVKNVLIPFFDESKFYYTGDNTSFTVNKTSIVAGNYLTLTAKVDFKDVYKSDVSDVNIVVELPEGTSFVDNSVMVGSSVAYYELDGNTLTVPFDNNTVSDRVRFCIVPTKSGNYAPSAAVAFKLAGKDVSQPIGSTNYTVEDISITVPSEINSPEITISGVATGKAEVTVYANDEVLGTAKALANGYWYLTTELGNPYNLQEYDIYANVTTPAGLSVNTETKSCLYNKDKIVAKTVEMSFYNGWMKKNISVIFDLEHQTSDATSYSFYTETDFTFAANLSNNDTALVKSVTIGVYTQNEGWINLEASYNAKMDRWVAVHKFGSSNLPIGVKVNFDADYGSTVDARIIDNAFNNLDITKQEMSEGLENVNELQTQLSSSFNKTEFDFQSQLVLMKSISDALGFTYEYHELDNISEYDIYKTAGEVDSLMNSGDLVYSLDSILNFEISKIDELKDYLNGIHVMSCEGLTEETLLNAGYAQTQKSDGTMYYILTTENGLEYVDLSKNIHYIIEKELLEVKGVVVHRAASTGYGITDVEAYCAKLESFCQTFQSIIQTVSDVIEQVEKKANASNEKLANKIGEYFDEALALQRKGGSSTKIKYLDAKIKIAIKAKQANNMIVNNLNKYLKQLRIGSGASRVFGVFGLVFTVKDIVKDMKGLITLYDSCLPCEGDETNAKNIQQAIVGVGVGAGVYYTAQLVSSIAAIGAIETGVIGAVPTGGLSLSAVAVSAGVLALNCGASIAYSKAFDSSVNGLSNRIKNLKCYICPKCHHNPCECCKICGNYPCTCKPKPEIPPILDPSGYVYEGVSSNRLQGVTATCYYKETVEDMYGDLHENVVLWDAEEYAQKNPLFTDENGMYQWDVPQGLWQVKFEKDGYVSTQSEWLPVPPPQMDVNIGMVQNAQPEVVKAKAYEDGVEVEFSKYMDIESLNNDNLYVKAVKDTVETLIKNAEIELLDKELAIEGSAISYASKVKLATDTLGYFDEAYIIVSTGVSSYAGVLMAQTFEQKLDVEKKIRSLLVDSVFNVAYNDSVKVTIAAIPADAAAGKTVSIVSASEMIVKADSSYVILDADGQASFNVSGELLGVTALNYSLEDAGLKATSLVNVVDPGKLLAVEAPVASRISGTSVYRGQTVALSCESDGATIYYTTDGSCPCDAATRIKYERPIVINDTMTLKIMSVGANFDESEVREYKYGIRQSGVQLNLLQGWNWVSHDLATPLDVNELSGTASRVLTQTAEMVDDPVLGFVGTLTSIDGAETMKIEAKKDTSKSFVGEQYNPSLTPITLHKGWNWLGYPCSLTMTLGDALSFMDVDEGDCITNLEDGFSTYTDGAWTGSLQTLDPGHGYLYKSATDKSFIYNSVPTVSNAKALFTSRLVTKVSPWKVDRHAYPSMMPVIAQICHADGTPVDSTYYIGAFAGDECRGIGVYDDGLIYLSVYGDDAVEVVFKAFNMTSGALHDFTESLRFTPDVVGSNVEPYRMLLGAGPTGIVSTRKQDVPVVIYNLNGIKFNSIGNPGIYIIQTVDADGNPVMKKQFVK